MKHYTKQIVQHNEAVTEDSESAADRYAIRICRQKAFSVAHVRTALLVNAAVKEQR